MLYPPATVVTTDETLPVMFSVDRLHTTQYIFDSKWHLLNLNALGMAAKRMIELLMDGTGL